MSQEQLAEAAGLDRSFLSMVERGIQSPNVAVLFKIAEVLGVSAAEIIAKMETTIRNPRQG
jgi:transcriptional regulator with XRE-family HTH domain